MPVSQTTRTESLNGDCVVATVGEFHTRLQGLIASGKALTLDLSQVGATDVTFIQLMVSASFAAARVKQPLVLAGFTPALRVAFERAGVDIDPTVGRIKHN